MRINKFRMREFVLLATFFTANIIGYNLHLGQANAVQINSLIFLNGDNKPKVYLLQIRASMDLAKVVSNPKEAFKSQEVRNAVDELQKTMNELYKPDGIWGDKSSAFIVLAEQHAGGVGQEPKPLVGKLKHADKCTGYIVNFKKRKNDLLLPQESKDRIESEIKKMEEALRWADDYKAGLYPAVPKWAKQWSASLQPPAQNGKKK